MLQDNNGSNGNAFHAVEALEILPAKEHKNGFRGPSPDVGKATQIKPGEVRNPWGRTGKHKPLQDEMEKALAADPELARKIAYKALIKAAKGDAKFFAEVRDMLDGRPELRIAGKDGESIQIQVEVSIARDKLIGRLAG